MKINKITNYIWFRAIAIVLIAAFFWNDIAIAGDFFYSNNSTLAITPLSSNPERSGVAWAMMICETVEKRAAKNYTKTIYLDDILLWKNSSYREFEGCKFDVLFAYEITISIPESNIKIRYFDPDPPAPNKPAALPPFFVSTKLDEKVINDHLHRQIIYMVKTLPKLAVSLADELIAKGITGSALRMIIGNSRPKDEIKELKGKGRIKLSPRKLKKLAKNSIDLSSMGSDFSWTWQEIKDSGVLSHKEIDVLEKHYLEKRTLEEIGDLEQYKVTKERVRQWEEKAIKKIREWIDGHLQPIQIKASANILPGHKVSAVEAAYGAFVQDKSSIAKTLLADSPDKVLLRVPIEPLKRMDEDEREEVRAFLEAFQQESGNGYVELYSSKGEVPGEMLRTYAKRELPEGFKKSRENTITLFEVKKDEVPSFDGTNLIVGRVEFNPLNTILLPVGERDDPAGIMRNTLFGLELAFIARQKKADLSIEEFAAKKIGIYNTLYNSIANKKFKLTAEDMITLATGSHIDFINALKKFIEYMPIAPINKEELHRIRENTKTMLRNA